MLEASVRSSFAYNYAALKENRLMSKIWGFVEWIERLPLKR